MDTWELWLGLTCALLLVAWLGSEALCSRAGRRWLKRLHDLERGRKAMARDVR